VALEERRLLFTWQKGEAKGNTQDIILTLNRELQGYNTIVLKAQYTKAGQLIALLGEYNSSKEVL